MELFADPGLIELVFVFGAALGIGFWQLFALRRTPKPVDEKAPEGPTDQSRKG